MQKEIIVNKNNISFKVEDSKELHQDVGYNFWSEKYSSWENSTFQVLDKYLSKDKDYLDIGSWVGPTAIYASFLSRRVFAVEPDPTAYKILQKNISLNSITNIIHFNAAASNLQTAYLKPNRFFGDSMTRVSENASSGIAVKAMGLDELISPGDFSLIKIDIEGHEFQLIKEYIKVLNQAKIPLFLSLHTPFFNNGESLLKELTQNLANTKQVFDEQGRKISLEQIDSSFGSYLFLW